MRILGQHNVHEIPNTAQSIIITETQQQPTPVEINHHVDLLNDSPCASSLSSQNSSCESTNSSDLYEDGESPGSDGCGSRAEGGAQGQDETRKFQLQESPEEKKENPNNRKPLWERLVDMGPLWERLVRIGTLVLLAIATVVAFVKSILRKTVDDYGTPDGAEVLDPLQTGRGGHVSSAPPTDGAVFSQMEITAAEMEEVAEEMAIQAANNMANSAANLSNAASGASASSGASSAGASSSTSATVAGAVAATAAITAYATIPSNIAPTLAPTLAPIRICNVDPEIYPGKVFLRLGNLNRDLSGVEREALITNFDRIYNEVMGGCDDIYERFGIDIGLSEAYVGEFENGIPYVDTFFEGKVRCFGCVPSEPFFGERTEIVLNTTVNSTAVNERRLTKEKLIEVLTVLDVMLGDIFPVEDVRLFKAGEIRNQDAIEGGNSTGIPVDSTGVDGTGKSFDSFIFTIFQFTLAPSALPSFIPSQVPSIAPSLGPSNIPSAEPSGMPSAELSAKPSHEPSVEPSFVTSDEPSVEPSVEPSAQPSVSPSKVPNTIPSSKPSGAPSPNPTASPTPKPSSLPSIAESTAPSTSPSKFSLNPSSEISFQPSVPSSNVPTMNPSISPSIVPTVPPSSNPSSPPSIAASSIPSSSTSKLPTSYPSALPSLYPHMSPSSTPSALPSITPSALPSISPSALPSILPSALPSISPSVQPTSNPSVWPTASPTLSPSTGPSTSPSYSVLVKRQPGRTEAPPALKHSITRNTLVTPDVEASDIVSFHNG